MKTFNVAVAVAVMLTFICVQRSSANQNVESAAWRHPIEAPAETDAVFIDQEMPLDSWKVPYDISQNRQARKCRICCNCCPRMRGCGVCCRF